MNQLAALAASVIIGLCLGLIGAGGSILTIPVLVYILKTGPVASTIYSMFIVGVCSLVGSVRSFAKKLVDVKVAVLFGIPSVTGVFIARKLIFPALPQRLFCIGPLVISKDVCIMFCLAIIMFIVSVKMLGTSTVSTDANGERVNKKILPFIMQGLLTGIVTGLLGVGGGFLIVPALLLWVKLPVKTAIGTTLVIITINSITGFLTSYASVPVNWALLAKFAAGAVAGILIGTRLSEKIQPGNLKKALSWFIIITSVYVLYKQFQICVKR